MTTVTRTVLVCDLCNASSDDAAQMEHFGPVKTHQLTIDGASIELEACQRCWREDFVAPAGPVVRRARVCKRKAKQLTALPELVAFPGQVWFFTFHALSRMGERHLPPGEVVTAVEKPETTHSGREVGTQVRIRGDVKVVVDPLRRSILTCARRDEELESVA